MRRKRGKQIANVIILGGSRDGKTQVRWRDLTTYAVEEGRHIPSKAIEGLKQEEKKKKNARNHGPACIEKRLYHIKCHGVQKKGKRQLNTSSNRKTLSNNHRPDMNNAER